MPDKPILLLDGYSLTPSQLFELSKGNTDIGLVQDALLRIEDGRNVGK
jgi:hypothetical protein